MSSPPPADAPPRTALRPVRLRQGTPIHEPELLPLDTSLPDEVADPALRFAEFAPVYLELAEDHTVVLELYAVDRRTDEPEAARVVGEGLGQREPLFTDPSVGRGQAAAARPLLV